MKNFVSLLLSLGMLIYLIYESIINYLFCFKNHSSYGRVIGFEKIDDGLVNSYWVNVKYFNHILNDSSITKLKYVLKDDNFVSQVSIQYCKFGGIHERILGFNDNAINKLVLSLFGVCFFLVLVFIFTKKLYQSTVR